ncbi:plant Tudor-like RNA-binding protein [Striga asiatica]|uniref:Plant Tudor-like RNA-binding protein n=1 Tax=Striga asiatica TaxID=4170 RepID=A0A5A7PZ30_STRAF|nr:plant Tudor-like RNA-binding protein [Striga asiatica]
MTFRLLDAILVGLERLLLLRHFYLWEEIWKCLSVNRGRKKVGHEKKGEREVIDTVECRVHLRSGLLSVDSHFPHSQQQNGLSKGVKFGECVIIISVEGLEGSIEVCWGIISKASEGIKEVCSGSEEIGYGTVGNCCDTVGNC